MAKRFFKKSNDGESPSPQTLLLREYQNIGFNILYSVECVTITINSPLSVKCPYMQGNVTNHGPGFSMLLCEASG